VTRSALDQSRWTTVRVREPADRAAVITALFAIGVEGVQELDDEVVTHIRDVDRDRVTESLRRVDANVRVEFAPTPIIDWSAEWRTRIGAHRLNGLVVTPPWLAEQHRESERIVIDPGMAFGTGEHETTRGVLRLMQRVVKPGDVVADLGAGSAILAIAAAKLGARRAIAIELDPDAIGNAQENVARNGVQERVSVIEGDAFLLLPLVAPVRVVVANIVSSVLVALLPVIAKSLTPDGIAILSGILLEERSEMETTLQGGGWSIVETDAEGMWWSATIARR
jgi:ribosomal protein L11 methyltransferase